MGVHEYRVRLMRFADGDTRNRALDATRKAFVEALEVSETELGFSDVTDFEDAKTAVASVGIAFEEDMVVSDPALGSGLLEGLRR